MRDLGQPDHRLHLGGGHGQHLWLHHIFTQTPFRKIYAETSELSLPQVRDAVRIPGVVEEGRLQGHIVHGDQRSDLVVPALYRERVLAELAARSILDERRVATTTEAGPTVTWSEFIADLIASDLLDGWSATRLADHPAGGLSLGSRPRHPRMFPANTG